MLGTIVMRLLADKLFEAAMATGSQYRSEIRQYLLERGLPAAAKQPTSPTK